MPESLRLPRIDTLPPATKARVGLQYHVVGEPFICVNNGDDTYSWQPLVGVPSSMQAELDGKADASHTHIIGDTTGLQAALDGKVNTSRILTTTFSMDLGALAAGAVIDTTSLLSGAAINDAVAVGAPSTVPSDAEYCGYVGSVNTVTLRVRNGGTVAFAAGVKTWRLTVIKP